MGKIFFSLIIAVSLFACNSNNDDSKKEKQPYLVVLSMDGFRWDYQDMVKMPNLDYIAAHGVRASMQPSFPSKTFPNHYTIASGLYPDNHGIVANEFWDDSLHKFYRISDRESVKNPAFYKGEPIWISAEKQNMISASLFWVGSETPIQGLQPSYWKTYQHNMSFEDRIDTVIAWLQLPEQLRPHLIMWYMHEPDGVGHRYGPDSKETALKLEYLDSLIGIFLRKVKKTDVADKVNLIFTSDHGMCSISPNKVVYFDDYIDTADLEIVTGANPVYNIRVKRGKLDKVYAALQLKHIKCWKHNELPKRLHYGNNPRDLDLIVVADSSWSVGWRSQKVNYTGGTHGYDNANSDMFAAFYAIGPAFKSAYHQKTFSNTDLYLLFAEILHLKPAKTDGKFSDIENMLNKKH